MFRLELLKSNGRPKEREKRKSKGEEFLPYLWLLLCLLSPLNFWFLILGLSAFAVAMLMPDIKRKIRAREFDKEFPDFLMYFRVAVASTDPYQAIEVARRLIDDPGLNRKAGELSKSLMLGIVNEIDTEYTSTGFQNFIGLLTNHQKLGLSLTETIEKLTSLTEERYVLQQREQIRTRPVTHTWIRLGTTAALLIYMYYPIFLTLIKGLLQG